MNEEEFKKAFETALTRIAGLEKEVAGHRAKPQPDPTPQFDPVAFARAFTADPVGVMTKMNVPVDHVNRVLVAHTLGDTAPAWLQAQAQQGPQLNATRAMQEELETLRRQISDITTSQTKKSASESFRALIGDKKKYPNLAKASAVDGSFFDDDLKQYGGSAEEFATREETRLAKLGYYVPQPASDEDADTTPGQSLQAKPAVAASFNGEMPPIAQKQTGVFSQADHEALRDSVVRKASVAAA